MKSVFRPMLASVVLWWGLLASAGAQWAIPDGGAVDIPAETRVDADCEAMQLGGELRIHEGRFSTASHFTVSSTGVLDLDAGTLSVGGDLINHGSFHSGAGTVELTDGCTGNTTRIAGTLVFQDLVLRSDTGRTFVMPAGSRVRVLGRLVLQGTPRQSLQVASSDAAAAVIELGPSATVQRSFAVVAGNVQIGRAGVAAHAVHGVPMLDAHGLAGLALLVVAVGAGLQRRFSNLFP